MNKSRALDYIIATATVVLSAVTLYVMYVFERDEEHAPA